MSLEGELSKSDKKIDSLLTDYTKRFDSSLGAIDKEISKIVSKGVNPSLAKSQIQSIFNNSSYAQTIEDYLSKGYQNTLDESYNLYDNLYSNKNFKFSDESLQGFLTRKEQDLDIFTELQNTLITRLNTEIVNATIAGLSPVLVEQTITNLIEKFKSDMTTELELSIARVYRTANTALAKDNDIERFKYVGPTGGNIRPFCLEYVGKIKTMDEWNELDNGKGQPKPVSEYQGGYRCRHSFVGVIDEDED